MATEKEKESAGLSAAEKDKLDDKEFAFPRERKEPLLDASHVPHVLHVVGHLLAGVRVSEDQEIPGLGQSDRRRPVGRLQDAVEDLV